MRIDANSSSDASLDYVKRVNRVIDHVLSKLDQPLDLEQLAQVACFSPFHFHRIFRSLVGETLKQFVKRLRLERALSLLSNAPGRSLTDIALACGFASSSDFSRSFKQRFGVPPSAIDIDTFRDQRREELLAEIADPELRYQLKRLPAGENPDGFEARVRRIPARSVAYIRVPNPYREGLVTSAAERLAAWAEANDMAGGQWLGYMWDDPDIVAHADCRYDVGVEVDPKRMKPDGEIGRFEFPEMLVAELEVRGPIDLEMRALDWLFGTWLPTSGYLPSSQPCFESWFGRPFEHGYEHFELKLQMPLSSH